ncbi:outer membrane lipoprotein LolB [Parashewanella spongiae]|uniref:Outer-membrane lipoprotein LolB n=1 Tax=Parashewanella spongiae TaxID=342950 RepID=A0A3A6TVA7_9GAMM|nr:lipoprotein insertase outer membrane protein LolB [Parashewanella spongiae]MCL1078357.1 lipoprotein insertase outer membrane protein LolB [Parashewanella spongiae]RJY16885.1 outer membrane lipoprotein LolB [Parashewanella spongiae]
MKISYHQLKYVLVAFSILAINACSSLPKTDLTAISVKQASQAQAWEMKGKLAVRTPQDKFSTNLYWLHTPQQDQLTLTTMLGTTVLSLTSTATGAKLDVDGKTYHDSNPEILLQRVAGWRFPIKRLPLWVTGQTSAEDIVLQQYNDGSPKHVSTEYNQTLWALWYLSWQQQSGAKLPKQLKVEQSELKLKIQINHWQALAEK